MNRKRIQSRDVHKFCEEVLAGIDMVQAHAQHETMIPALEQVSREFPNVRADYLICLWIGVNAKDLAQKKAKARSHQEKTDADE